MTMIDVEPWMDHKIASLWLTEVINPVLGHLNPAGLSPNLNPVKIQCPKSSDRHPRGPEPHALYPSMAPLAWPLAAAARGVRRAAAPQRKIAAERQSGTGSRGSVEKNRDFYL